jgi:hypothetical protein
MYEARDEAAREKIRQMVRQGKDPESIGNYDGQVRDYQDRSGNIYAIRDEVAREKIRILVQQGKNPESLGNYDSDIRDYQDRCNERSYNVRNNQDRYDSQQKSQATLNKTCTAIILELQKSLNANKYDLMRLNDSFEILVKSLAVDGNPDWYITQLFDLKKQYEARMSSINYDYEKTIRDKKAEAKHKAEIEKAAEIERVRIYNNSRAGKAASAKAIREKENRNIIRVCFQIFWLLVMFIAVPTNLNSCSNQGNRNHTSEQRASDTFIAILTFCIIPVSILGLIATSNKEK